MLLLLKHCGGKQKRYGVKKDDLAFGEALLNVFTTE